MKNSIFGILFLLVAISSCSKSINATYVLYESDSLQHWNLNPYLNSDVYDENDILDSLKFVCLETTENSLVSEICKVIVSDDRIFIHDYYQAGGVIIFDTRGKFIKRIANGNGPGEIPRVITIGYDNYREELLVLNHTLMVFDKNGEYKGQKDRYFPCDNIIACTPNSYIFSKVYGHTTSYPELENYSLIITDSLLEIKQLLLPYNHSTKVVSSPIKGMASNENVFISIPFTDTIYCYRNDSVFPCKTIDISNNQLNVNQFASMQEYIQQVLAKESATGLRFEGGFFENSTHAVLGLLFGRNLYPVFIDKQSSNIVAGRSCIYNNDQSLGISSPVGVHSGWFFEIRDDFPHNTITSSRYISKEDLAKLEQLKDDSNPFIMFYKLKDF